MRWIRFFEAHLWLGVAYFAIFLAALIYLKSRNVRLELRRLGFLVLGSPAMIYAWACMHIGCKLVSF
jgi:hypothetical protein